LTKQYKLKVTLPLKPLAEGLGGCMVSNRISVDGLKVGLMYRDEADRDEDSGWSFLAGDESDEYLDDPENAGVFDVNTIANHDPAIVPYLDEPPDTSLERVEGTDTFEEI